MAARRARVYVHGQRVASRIGPDADSSSPSDGPADKRGTNLKKAITVIAALVAVLAVTSGAFAAKQYLIVSSKQIKKGAISLSDLSRHAHQALKGSTGATGASGRDGLTGPQGLQGPGGRDGRDGLTGPQGKQGLDGNAGAPGAQGLKGDTGAAGPKGDKGDTGAMGPALPADFSTSSSFTESGSIDTIVPVTLTTGGVKFGPYPNGGTQGGSLRYDGFDGKTVGDLNHLQFTFSYASDDHSMIATPYMRVFTKDANGEAHDIILDPSQCAQATVPETTSTTRTIESVDYLRYDDDACDSNNKLTWAQIKAAHGGEAITAIKVSEGFSGGVNATAFVKGLEVNSSVFAFPAH